MVENNEGKSSQQVTSIDTRRGLTPEELKIMSDAWDASREAGRQDMIIGYAIPPSEQNPVRTSGLLQIDIQGVDVKQLIGTLGIRETE